jgi:diguanylate cyclase (GGDEF)-like protein
MVTKQGETIYALVNGKCEVSKNGKHIVSAVFVDISGQKIMQDMLLLEGERYRIASELTKDILFEYDIKNDEIIFTGKFKDLFGRNPKMSSFCMKRELRRDVVHPDDWGIYLEFCNELSAGSHMIETEFRLKDRLNNFIWCQVMGKTIYDEDRIPVRVIGKYVNVDIQKRELEALEYKATRDPLTGVYNKEVTIKKIDKFISGNRTGKHALMFVDFDDFKLVNDNYGHLVGDRVLIYVIGRIKNVFSEGEIIGRIGGDEFVVLSGNIDAEVDIEEKAKLLVTALNTTFRDDELSIQVSGSIGIALYPKDGLHYEQLILDADKAMYKVKAQGKNNYMFYSSLI